MRYLLYVVRDGHGMSLLLVGDGQPRPQGDARLVRAFASREQALEAMEGLREEFVFPVGPCVARAEAEAR
jgi:hypothetical protein